MSKILIIDDDPQFTQLMSLSLSRNNIQSDIAHNTTDGQNLLKKNSYDLILLDVYLPNKDDGLGFLQKYSLNYTPDSPPIILASSATTQLFQEEENFDQYIDMAKEFISKNENPKAITDRIIEILQEKNSPEK